MISQKEKLKYWLDSAVNDQETAKKLFEASTIGVFFSGT